MPKPNLHYPRETRPEPEAVVAGALLALARPIGRSAAREHLAASESMKERRDAG